VTAETYFKVLGLSRDASWDEVKKSFRRLARVYHPDVAGPSGARKFAEITEAYMTLKAAISPEASPIKKIKKNIAKPRGGEERASEPELPRASVFREFWRKLFRRLKDERRARSVNREGAEEISPARVRFVGSVISGAESQMLDILSKREETDARRRTEAIVRRLRSRRPEVVMMALKRVSKRDWSDEISQAIIDSVRFGAPAAEILPIALELFSGAAEPRRRADLARAIVSNANKFPDGDAIMALKYFKRWNLGAEYGAAFLSHRSSGVVAAALNHWPSGDGDVSNLFGLLKHDDDTILVPLLRLLRHKKIPSWMLPRLTELMRENASPAVRVWASAIVRDQNVS
jgi:curved DNA-binding protein CbpA